MKNLRRYRLIAADGTDLGVWEGTDPERAVHHAEWGRLSGPCDDSVAIPRDRLEGCTAQDTATGQVYARYARARNQGVVVATCDVEGKKDDRGRVVGKHIVLEASEARLDPNGYLYIPLDAGQPASKTRTLYELRVFTRRDGTTFGAYPSATRYYTESDAMDAMKRKAKEAQKRIT